MDTTRNITVGCLYCDYTSDGGTVELAQINMDNEKLAKAYRGVKVHMGQKHKGQAKKHDAPVVKIPLGSREK